jgi:hypothetical protein
MYQAWDKLTIKENGALSFMGPESNHGSWTDWVTVYLECLTLEKVLRYAIMFAIHRF